VFEIAKSPTVTGVRADWAGAAIILIFAAALRIAFFSRGLGTDEIVYISQAYRLLEGQFPHATYLERCVTASTAFRRCRSSCLETA
jgi:hypothetical protein